MPQSCAVPVCPKRNGGHKFPKDEERLKQWLVAIRREDFTPTKYSCVCKDHFTKDDYEMPKDSVITNPKPMLKKTAVPSKFPWHEPNYDLLLRSSKHSASCACLRNAQTQPGPCYQKILPKRDPAVSDKKVTKVITKKSAPKKNTMVPIRLISIPLDPNKLVPVKLIPIQLAPTKLVHIRRKNSDNNKNYSAVVKSAGPKVNVTMAPGKFVPVGKMNSKSDDKHSEAVINSASKMDVDKAPTKIVSIKSETDSDSEDEYSGVNSPPSNMDTVSIKKDSDSEDEYSRVNSPPSNMDTVSIKKDSDSEDEYSRVNSPPSNMDTVSIKKDSDSEDDSEEINSPPSNMDIVSIKREMDEDCDVPLSGGGPEQRSGVQKTKPAEEHTWEVPILGVTAIKCEHDSDPEEDGLEQQVKLEAAD